MRFKFNIPEPKPEPSQGTIRIIEQFLWMPTCVENDKGETEIRWLETCKIKQKYSNIWNGYCYSNYWQNLEFVDEKPEQKTNPQPVQE